MLQITYNTRASAEFRGHHQRHGLRAPGQPFGHPPPDATKIPKGRIRLPDLFLPGIWERVLAWFKAADAAMAALQSGNYLNPGTLVITQDDLQPWARGILWDTVDPENCVFATPSNRERLEADRGAKRSIDGGMLRRIAVEIGWDDLDICDQVEDGLEARSTCSLTTHLAFHHTGIARQLDAAKKVISADIAEGWVRKAVRWLPRVPIRCLPRNVIMQDKQKVDPESGKLVHFQKPRISTDEGESNSDDSPNAGIPRAETALDLCSPQDFGLGCAIVGDAFGGLSNVGAAVIDLESAFRFLVLQWLDLWLHAFLWWDDEGKVGICIDLRMAFGGAFGPNRFQRVTLLLRAYITYRISQFNLDNPLPPTAREWQRDRAQAQRDGILQLGPAQREPNYIQVFLDDFALTGGTDRVKVPLYLHDTHIVGVPGTLDPATGGTFLPRDTRIHVIALICLWCIELLRLASSAPKCSCATRVICLGLRVLLDSGIIDCPPNKAQIMILTIQQLRLAVTTRSPLDIEILEKLVGRLGYIAQIYAAIRLWMAAGYALTRLRYRANNGRARAKGGRRALVRYVNLKPDGRREREILRLFDLAEAELHDNVGIPLASRATFPAFGETGSALIVTDASGVDGVGGYAIVAAEPRTVWLFSEWWSPEVKVALDMVARPPAERVAGAPRFAMPAAEAFGHFAVAHALDAHHPILSVTAIGDCLPASRAFLAGTSASAQVRHILRASRLVATQWLAVQIPRELNVDPDRLSHPNNYEAVKAEVRRAGFRVERLRLHRDGWRALEEAYRLPLAVDEMDPAFT